MDSNTAGTAMNTEFQKYGFKPEHCAPVQALSQAKAQASNRSTCGQLTKLVCRMSSASLSEVASITYSGVKNTKAATAKAM